MAGKAVSDESNAFGKSDHFEVERSKSDHFACKVERRNRIFLYTDKELTSGRPRRTRIGGPFRRLGVPFDRPQMGLERLAPELSARP